MNFSVFLGSNDFYPCNIIKLYVCIACSDLDLLDFSNDLIPPFFFAHLWKQPSQVTILDLKSNDSADSSKLCESRELSELKSGTLKEETGEADTPTETCTSMNSSSQLQAMKTKVYGALSHPASVTFAFS